MGHDQASVLSIGYKLHSKKFNQLLKDIKEESKDLTDEEFEQLEKEEEEDCIAHMGYRSFLLKKFKTEFDLDLEEEGFFLNVCNHAYTGPDGSYEYFLSFTEKYYSGYTVKEINDLIEKRGERLDVIAKTLFVSDKSIHDGVKIYSESSYW